LQARRSPETFVAHRQTAQAEVNAMLKSVSLLLVLAALAMPVAAADQKQCADRFKAADLNNDGALSRDEIGSAKQTLPSSLTKKDRVTRQEFMAACSKNGS
jgi:hypothetical protein